MINRRMVKQVARVARVARVALYVAALSFEARAQILINTNTGGAPGSGTVTDVAIAGTANQITATGSCSGTVSISCTLALANNTVLPGAPTISSFTNATHNHSNAAGGGTFNTVNASTCTGTPSSTTFLRGDCTWATPTLTIGSGTKALATNSIASAACEATQTLTVTGTASTDTILITPNASIKAVTGYTATTDGGLSITVYPTTNTVNIDVCNWTANSITPGAVTLNVRVVR